MPRSKSLPKSARPNLSGETLLRALAIIAVVGIHAASGISPSPFWNSSPLQPWFVAMDQLFRICVPLFVVLSGYGLVQKYQHTEFSLIEFLQRRVFKLLPAYFGWSVLYGILFRLIPGWYYSSEPMQSFWLQLLKGQADYQLYFVPMIFQLYLLFPLIWWLVAKKPWLSLAAAGIFQVWWYVYLTQLVATATTKTYFLNDQHQYYWFFTWIWYFVLGMVFSLKSSHKIWPKILPFLALLSVGAWLAVSQQALQSMHAGLDPLFALRFTRLPILVFTSLSAITLILATRSITKIPSFLASIGKHSYSIYLGHTLLLRIIFLVLSKMGLH